MMVSEPTATRSAPPWAPIFAAVQFLTRIPVPAYAFTDTTLPRAAACFPAVGAGLGLAAGLLDRALLPHLSALPAAVCSVIFLVAVTGAMHEDALADCADAFGLRRPAERTLAIMRDSAIGSFGGAALVLSLGLRVALIAALPPHAIVPVLVSAATLGRWSTLPLTLLPPARPETGQGMTLAQRTSTLTLAAGSIFALAVTLGCMRGRGLGAIAAALLIVLASAAFYRRRIGGVTGDCFGATNQLVEIAVLACGAWIV